MNETFGNFVRTKREGRGITLRKFAAMLGIAPAYLCDIEKAKRNPPDQEKLYQIAELLKLSKEEQEEMFDLAAKAKAGSVSPDLVEYIMSHPGVRTALRTARDLDTGDEAWLRVAKEFQLTAKGKPMGTVSDDLIKNASED